MYCSCCWKKITDSVVHEYLLLACGLSGLSRVVLSDRGLGRPSAVLRAVLREPSLLLLYGQSPNTKAINTRQCKNFGFYCYCYCLLAVGCWLLAVASFSCAGGWRLAAFFGLHSFFCLLREIFYGSPLIC